MASYGGGEQSAAYSSSATSTDPYAQFYYWDTTRNDWAFDYDRYYATYGYPTTAASGTHGQGYDYAEYSQQAYQQASAYGGASGGSSSGNAYGNPYTPIAAQLNAGPSTSSDDQYAPSMTERRKRVAPGPKDAEGNPIAGHLKKGETRKTVLRKAPGNQLYEDQTLLEWDPSHKRLFVGDLGNDVTDEMLAKAFGKYSSFSKARVVRRKGDEKSKGYGFVAFADPHDFLKAWKEMDGKFIGSRPCRLKKADDNVMPTEIGARKDKLLAANAKYDAFKNKLKMGGAVGGEIRRHGIGKAWRQK